MLRLELVEFGVPAIEVLARLVKVLAQLIELDEGGFAGEGEMYLFASILNEMFAAYVSLNSFTQVSVTGTNTRVVYRWEPKSGSLTLI